MEYHTRAEWGGPAAPIGKRRGARAISITVHHSESPVTVRGGTLQESLQMVHGIHNYHTNERKWAGIGYNALIDQSGRVFEGRGADRIGAHAGNEIGNRTSIGICLLLDGEVTPPSPEAVSALFEYAHQLVTLGMLEANWRLRFHRDWKATTCPGKEVVATLSRLDDDRVRALPVLRKGSRGAEVRKLQQLLGVKADGIFGERTRAAVVAFQGAHNLEMDGIVGQKTWLELLTP